MKDCKLSHIAVLARYLLYLWIISCIFSSKLSHAALKFTFTSPVHITKNFNLPYSNGHHKTAADMKLHIKRVLNIHSENSTLDKYISKLFNINNLNPTYVFRIPDKNKTLILRNSDFKVPIYPNITNLNKFTKNNKVALKPSSSNQHQIKVKSEEVLEELKHERMIFQRNLDGNHDDEDYDDEMRKILEENVKNERDFATLLNELNEDLDYYDVKPDRSQEKTSFEFKKSKVKNVKVQTSTEDEWTALGLDGWSGLMTSSKDQLPKTSRPKIPKKMKTSSIPFLQNINPFGGTSSTAGIKPSKNQQQDVSSNESALEMEDLSNQLSSLLLENEKILLNKTGRIPTVRWPITTTRDQHSENDVFIARANNPFGHSTRWKLRNSTDDDGTHRESRSKRGVLHLYSMIKCATGCDPLQYKGYGCYCGFLGSGRALDGIDRCCKAHDYCYTNANCFFYTEYLVPYLWKCYRGKPLCAIDNGEFGGPYSCATRLCECDRALSKCLRHYYCPRKRSVCTSNPFRLLQNLVMVF